MVDGWRNRRAERRVRAGAGQPLQRFRWWQVLGRSLLTITLPASDGTASSYAIDVRRNGDASDGLIRARLYVDNALQAHSKVPARFTVTGGHIEVAVGTFGLRRCHYVRADGHEEPLTPDPASSEGRRARLHRAHPTLSRVIGFVSGTFVVLGLCITAPQLAEEISRIPLVADSIGVFDSPVNLPLLVNLTIGLAAVVGSTERAMRMRSSWLDDLAS